MKEDDGELIRAVPNPASNTGGTERCGERHVSSPPATTERPRDGFLDLEARLIVIGTAVAIFDRVFGGDVGWTVFGAALFIIGVAMFVEL